MDVSQNLKEISQFPSSPHYVGILIGYTDTDQLHCGIVYKSDETKFSALHLAWHQLLCNENDFTKFPTFYFVTTSLNQIRARVVSAKCRKIWTNKLKNVIPYGLHYNGCIFNEQGIIQLPADAVGLTCATFVLSVFKSCGHELIDIKNWKPNPEKDQIWQQKIISYLTYHEEHGKHNVTKEHIKIVKEEVKKGVSRFRPESVAVSSLFNPLPASQDIIENASDEILKFIQTYDKAKSPEFCSECV